MITVLAGVIAFSALALASSSGIVPPAAGADQASNDSLRAWATAAGATVALLALVVGVIQYMHQNAIRRYEKFKEMSVRFDESKEIQRVCKLLEGVKQVETVTAQDKEVFICFIEEIYFMVLSKIMRRDLALYSFGYYARLVEERKEEFWSGLDSKQRQPFFIRFREFCLEATSYDPGGALAKSRDRKRFTF